jgi:diguanylate cyclase (GGDEF)-like protein
MLTLPTLLIAFVTTPGLLVDTAALAAVALVGYLFGLGRSRKPGLGPSDDPNLRDELGRAQSIADDMRRLATNISVETAAHSRSVAAFQSQLAAMQTGDDAGQWQRLRETADGLVGPTLKLYTNLVLACDQLRRQKSQLAAFTGSRLDPATGLCNRRAFEEQLAAFVSIHSGGKRRFALAMFSVSSASADASSDGEQCLSRVARLLEDCLRDDDFVARYSNDEFVVLMPHTPLAGALAFSERLLVRALADLDCPLWGGVVEAGSDESQAKLLSRADSALYSARAAGGASLFQHTGQGVRRHPVMLPKGTPAGDAAWGIPLETECVG